MKQFLFLLPFLVSSFIFSQTYEGPYPQITEGYGAFGNHPISEKKFNNTYLLDQGYAVGDGGVEITIRYASDVEGPMPTVLFAPGWGQYDTAIFEKLLDFIASKGYCVVFTPYPAHQEHSSWENSLYYGMKQAIDENSGVNDGDLNIIDTTKIGLFGHSLGAGDIFWLGKKFYVDHDYGSNAKFLFSVAGWIGFNTTDSLLENYPSDCKLRVEIWEEDDHNPANDPPGGTSPRIQYYLFYKINIPDSEKNYVKVFGGPDSDGYHYATNHRLVTMERYDALDFYAIFRPLDAMMDYTFNSVTAARDLALGFDKDMGPFPDLDTDYNTFVFAYPESDYEYPCDVESNPHRAHCPSGPLAIETLNPLVARQKGNEVLLYWSTATEIDNAGFEIQRSADGQNWEKIGWVEGQYTSNEKHHYKAVDKNPMNGINYYRFKQIDFDEKYTFSDVVSISFEQKNQVRLFPNPGDGVYYFNLSEDVQVNFIIITDISNKIVRQLIPQGNNFDISDLPQGMYFANFYTPYQVIQKKLILN